MERFERVRLIKLLKDVDASFQIVAGGRDSRPFWNVLAHLVENTDSGKTATITSLASTTGLPYSTSRRFILDLISDGVIEQRPRTKTGRTFSLHASAETERAFDAFLDHFKQVLIETMGLADSVSDASYFYFGARGLTAIPSMDRDDLSAIADTGLKFLLHDDPYFISLRNLWFDFRSGLGAKKSDIVLIKGMRLRQEIAANHELDQSQYDILSVDLAYMDELARRGVIRPLDNVLNPAQADELDGLGALGKIDGRLYGVPIYCATNMFAIRTDLFEAAGLPPPARFDEVIAAGRELNAPKLNRAGIVWDARRGTAVATTFRTLLVAAGAFKTFGETSNFSKPGPKVSVEEFAAIVSSNEALQTLEFLSQLVEISPANILDMAWDVSVDTFMRGHAAMCFSWSNYMSQAEYDPRSIARHRIKYLTQPTLRGGVKAMPLSGYVLSIPANVTDARAASAAKAIRWLISTGTSRNQSSTGLPIAPRFSDMIDPETRPGMRVQRFIQKQAEMRRLQTQYRPIGSRFLETERILGDEIHDALAGLQTPKIALKRAAAQILQLAREGNGTD
ncbi:extracellular solute-binding protein [Sinisalibacter aestuarii]|uniref:Extracellular solute-binding protein n=1 Tax=Sinisalibacter aestuarii TaxID=2949426 RepID=A0ABQ5LSI4_9RHOB|nr:extracellular solute-binding protein [Sinisalibacter aestuarii]GKY87037.1 hypothetical protein STA1M1_09060 [Sinisalibacter aestuarii]